MMLHVITAGTRTRRREVKRAAVRPHGQCLSELVQRQQCLLDLCFTYTNMVNNGEREAICIRSDGLIVEGKLHLQSSTCPRLNPTTHFPKMLFCFTQANLLFVLPILKIL